MEIDHYTFGRISISGREYDADIIIFPDHVQERWHRRQGHRLAPEDLETVIAETPQLLVIGTGYFGRMQVPEETLARLQAEGIEVRVSKTSEAVDEFNRLQKDNANIIIALHLTC
ncbi:MAG: MTH938/NDUFAF3 family protein [Candidatus Thiodiazotropha sp.]|jgi:hypothetical protein